MKRKITLGIIIVLVAGITLAVLANLYVYEMGSRYIISSESKLPKEEAAIVLGAAVLNDDKTLSGVLKDRVDMSISLYKAGIVQKILVTGDNSTLQDDEVSPVRRYLIAAGIPAEDIFLDHAGFDTYSSMYRAKAIFDVSSAIVVTQEFHLPRATYLARSMGITAYGIPADKGTYALSNYLREMLARPKALWDVLVHRTPEYLGQQYPITGNGEATWE